MFQITFKKSKETSKAKKSTNWKQEDFWVGLGHAESELACSKTR